MGQIESSPPSSGIRCRGHKNAINKVAVFRTRAGGIRVASASDDETLRVWDGLSGECVAILKGHTNSVCAVACYDVNGFPRIASGSGDRTVRVWNLGRCLAVLRGHKAVVWTLSTYRVGHNLTRIVSGSQDKTVRIWDGVNGDSLFLLDGQGAPVTTLACHDQRVFSGGADGSLLVWDGETGRSLDRKKVDGTLSVLLRFGDSVASGSDDFVARIWRRDEEEAVLLVGHTDAIRCIACLEPTMIATGSADTTVLLWDSDSTAAPRRILPHSGSVEAVVCYSVDAPRVASACSDGTVRIWDGECGTLLAKREGHRDFVGSIVTFDASPAERHGPIVVATGSDDATVRLWTFDEDLRSEADVSLETVATEIEEGRLSGGSHALVDALRDLDEFLIGRVQVKRKVAVFVRRALTTTHRILNEDLNTIIEGPPGTGKTQIARRLYYVLNAMGFVREGAVLDDVSNCSKRLLLLDDVASCSCTRQEMERVLEVEQRPSSTYLRTPRTVVIAVGEPDQVSDFLGAEDALWRFQTQFIIDDFSPAELESVFRVQLGRLGWRIAERTTLRGLFNRHSGMFARHPFCNGAGTETLAHWTTTLLKSQGKKSKTVCRADLELTIDVMRGAAPPILMKKTIGFSNPDNVAVQRAQAAAAPYRNAAKSATPPPPPPQSITTPAETASSVRFDESTQQLPHRAARAGDAARTVLLLGACLLPCILIFIRLM